MILHTTFSLLGKMQTGPGTQLCLGEKDGSLQLTIAPNPNAATTGPFLPSRRVGNMLDGFQVGTTFDVGSGEVGNSHIFICPGNDYATKEISEKLSRRREVAGETMV
jgi:hypothetical protein